MRKLLIAAALGAVAAVSLIPSGTAAAAPANGFLRSDLSYPVNCLEVPEGDRDNGTPVRIARCDPGRRKQDFTVDRAAISTIRVLGKCVDVHAWGTAPGTRVQIWDCHGGGNQQWQTVPVPGFPAQFFFIRNPYSGRCLRANGAGAVIEDCPAIVTIDLANMVWALEPQLY